jgi:hypothetical protein
MATVQRLLPVACSGRLALPAIKRRSTQRQVRAWMTAVEVLRSHDSTEAIRAAPAAASIPLEFAVPTARSQWRSSQRTTRLHLNLTFGTGGANRRLGAVARRVPAADLDSFGAERLHSIPTN